MSVTATHQRILKVSWPKILERSAHVFAPFVAKRPALSRSIQVTQRWRRECRLSHSKACRSHRNVLHIIKSSAAGASGESAGASSEGPALSAAYSVLAAVIGASAAARLAAPSLYMQLANAACPGAALEALLRLTGATLLPVTAAFWVLKGAAEHDRLGSNTYRRLNLGLVAWAAVNLALLAKESSALTYWCLSIQVAFYVATVAVGGYSWASTSGFAPTGRQIIDGFLGDVQALFSNKTFLSGLLALLSVAAVAVGVLILNQPLTYFQPSEFRLGAGLLGKIAMRSYAANILFSVVVLTTLKDALDRGRHTASTFKLLAKSAVATAIAEIAIFATTGSTSGIIREVIFGAVMTSYLLVPKAS